MRSWTRPDLPALHEQTPDAPRRVSVFDTASSSLIPVGPAAGQADAVATLYVCGITPYDATHLGHANTYVAFDLLNRAWRDLGADVRYVQNVTDVDDPLLERAAQTGVDWRELAAEQTDLFRADMEALRVLPPDHYVGATEFVDEVGELIGKLKDLGYVYQIDDEHRDWYFRCRRVPTFMEVSHLDRAEARASFAEHGGDPDRVGKEDPLDCLVWRQERDGEPSWASPLGAGRPGWHIECTSIALTYLGEDFDVQGGGSDLAFPHHEMCAAEARAATDKAFAKAYVHSGMVALDGQKMSKSLGNLELVSRLRGQGVDPAAIRLALLSQHYRADWEWSARMLTVASERLDLWRRAVALAKTAPAGTTIRDVRTAMRTDLDAPTALTIVDEWATTSLMGGSVVTNTEAASHIADLVDALLGVRLAVA